MGFETIEHDADLCVVGGGLAGLCAAVSAARHGASVVLMQERPMLGGNASSEIRMWICGADNRHNMRETGIIEELLLENQYRNPDKNYNIWDGILYELAAYQKGLTLLLNCTCNDCECENGKITSVTGWQMTTQKFHKVKAKIFADCSGDSVLAPLTGAEYRVGREAKTEFQETGGQETADLHTMGLSILLQARQTDRPSEFIPPRWAYHYTKEDLLPYHMPDLASTGENFWFLEIGGDENSIDDTEKLRDELLRIAYGIWDFCKNDPENKEKNRCWQLDWMGILPGKRESRRYIGDYVLNQNDPQDNNKFEDVVAYGGWGMDDHNIYGFKSKDRPNHFHRSTCPYQIPYRSLYSVNIENLMMAGRNISATHIALSSTRVMATCALLGQAVGTAAAIAVKYGISPRMVGRDHIRELQNTLMDDDCWLPYRNREISPITASARLSSSAENVEALRNGVDRPVGTEDNGCYVNLGESVVYTLEKPTLVRQIRIIFDSDLNRESLPENFRRPMLANRPRDYSPSYVPTTMTKAYRIEIVDENGASMVFYKADNNYQRLNKIPVNKTVSQVKLTPLATWGAEKSHIFAFDLL